jgi:glycerol-3-phosphate dehydrogenase
MAVFGPTTEIQEKLEMLQNEDKEVQHKLNEEEYNNYSLNHMMARMKKDFIASKIKTGSNEQALKNRAAVIDFEGSKQRKTKEDRLQSRTTFINLMKNIESE